MSTFGERLRQARKDARLTQKKLAVAMGWEDAQGRISNYERSERRPHSYEDVKKLSKILNVDVLWLLYGDGMFYGDESPALTSFKVLVKDYPPEFVGKLELAIRDLLKQLL